MINDPDQVFTRIIIRVTQKERIWIRNTAGWDHPTESRSSTLVRYNKCVHDNPTRIYSAKVWKADVSYLIPSFIFLLRV